MSFMEYHIATFGCQMNSSDSERIAAVLDSLKYKPARDIDGANLVVINACSVRQSAVDRVYGLLGKIKQKKKEPITILTGCVLKKDKIKFSKIFDYVIDIKEIFKLPELLARQQVLENSRSRASMVAAKRHGTASIKASEPQGERSVFEKTWLPSGYVQIMNGCNNFCSYCVVPYTRGREISRPAKEIIAEIKNLVKNNCKEIWLLGQNVNSYHSLIRTNGSTVSFAELLKMADNIPGNFELNFTSSHPKDFSDELIKTMAKCKKLSKRLNLPIQSGDDEILRKMNRPYTVLQYKNLVEKIRKAIPDILLSTDIIVGFPGETKKQFANTVKTLKEIGFGMAFINKYSPRAGTEAAKLKDNVPWAEKKRREKILIDLINEKNKK